jgi:type VI secretion system protein ImpJ
MFLRPHHLQQHDLHLEARESLLFRILQPHAFGLVHLRVQDDGLRNYTFAVSELRAVLPEGALVDVPDNARLPMRSFEMHMKEAGRPLDVSIGVRAREPRVAQTHAGSNGDGEARFVARDEEVYDLDVGRDAAPLEVLEYHLRLFFGDEPTHGYDTLPIARLVRTADPASPVALATDWSPPVLVLEASPLLREVARGVTDEIANVLRSLDQVAGSAENINRLMLFQALAGSFPVLRELVQDGLVHPRLVHLELARVAGALFNRRQRGRTLDDIPPYDHRNPGPAFVHLRELIREWSEHVHVEDWKRLPMARQGDHFRVSIPPELRRPGCRYFIEAHAAESTGRIRPVMLTAKISAPDRIGALSTYALPGVPTEFMTGPPSELGPGQTGSFFRLKHEEQEWSGHVLPSAELEVFLLNAPGDLQLQLLVILPKA